LLIDGVHFAEHVVLAAVGVDDRGTKHVLGLREGGVDPVSWSVFGRKGKEESDAKNTSTVPGRVSAADGRTGARGTVAEGVSA